MSHSKLCFFLNVLITYDVNCKAKIVRHYTMGSNKTKTFLKREASALLLSNGLISLVPISKTIIL